MNLQLINTLYKQIISSSPGAERIKIDLHVHTPASHDFVYKPLSKEEAYLNLLNEAIEKDIRIIAITDHNTFEGVKTVRKILQKAELAQKYNRLLILCGIEITCFSKHLLATVYKGNIIKNLIMDCQSYTKYRPNETTGGIFVSWRRKEELPTGA